MYSFKLEIFKKSITGEKTSYMKAESTIDYDTIHQLLNGVVIRLQRLKSDIQKATELRDDIRNHLDKQ